MSIDSINSVGSPYSSTSTAAEGLTSGLRINNSGDDAAGLAVAIGMTSDIMRDSVGIRNGNDGIGLLKTADGAAQGLTNSMQRMYELSMQAMNGTLNNSQRNMLNAEFQQHLQEIERTAQTTKFNGVELFNGSNESIDIALGENSTSSLKMPNLTLEALGLDGLDLTNVANAGQAAETLMKATEQMGDHFADFGAQQNGLYSAISGLAISAENTQASRSQIMDADFAKLAAAKAKEDVKEQAFIMMHAHKNHDKANVLQLIN